MSSLPINAHQHASLPAGAHDFDVLEGEYNPYYHQYIRLVPPGDVLAFLQAQPAGVCELLSTLSEEQLSFRPAPGEWTIKQVIGHMIDIERIFSFRALHIARRDGNPLPGMQPDPYVAHAHFDAQALNDLLEEFSTVRRASIQLFRGFSAEDLLQVGVASGNSISVRALISICAGHVEHHLESIRTVYLNGAGA